jgi:hypothetical protein
MAIMTPKKGFVTPALNHSRWMTCGTTMTDVPIAKPVLTKQNRIGLMQRVTGYTTNSQMRGGYDVNSD